MCSIRFMSAPHLCRTGWTHMTTSPGAGGAPTTCWARTLNCTTRWTTPVRSKTSGTIATTVTIITLGTRVTAGKQEGLIIAGLRCQAAGSPSSR
eukprot:scaffold75312_cov57-Phaeocystis_antarctica.AAC.1